MKNKILAAVIGVLLLMTLVITASAQGTVATTENKSCAKGGTVTLNVSITSTSEVTSGGVEVIYDKDVLELISAEWKTDGALISTFDMATDKGAFAYTSGKTLSGKIFSVTFKVLDNAPVGKTDVECILQLKKNVSEDIAVTSNKGSVDVTCKHSFTEKSNQYQASRATCTSPAIYYYSCSICGEQGGTTYTVGSALPHTFDRTVAAQPYLVENVKCADTAAYYYSCKCGAKGSETFTADASWSHSFSSELFVSREGHWYACSDCGSQKDYADHTPVSGICSVCNFVFPTGEHTHSYGTELERNSVGHWSECACGDKKDLAFHTYGDWTVNGETQSRSCSACGYIDTESVPKEDEVHTHSYGANLEYNSVGHWSECACGDKKDLAFHTYGDWTVNGETQSRSCSACGYIDTESVPKEDEVHTHSYGANLEYNSVGHWSECACGDKKDLAFHTYGDWTVNGETQSRTCSACGYVETVSVPDDDENGDNNTDVPEDDGTDAVVVGIICSICGIAATALSFGIFLYIRKNRDKSQIISTENTTDEDSDE